MKNTQNLLFVGPWPPPFGGIASNLYELLPAIKDKGYNVTTLSYTEEDEEIVRQEMGVDNIYFSPTSFFKKNIVPVLISAVKGIKHRKGLTIKRYMRAVAIAERVNRIVEKQEVSFIFTYDNDQLHLAPFIRRTSNSPRVFSTIYGAFFLNPGVYLNEKKFLRHAVNKSDKILSCSRYCADSGKEFLNMDYPTKVIYNNVDEELYKPDNDGKFIRERYNISDNAVVMMTMGRIGVDMGIDFLIREINAITAIDKNLIVFFVGARAELCEEVEELAKTNSQVRFAFSIPFEEKPYFFAACDIFTAPTKDKHACMGIANIEAMMSGKAVIASTSGGHPETIEDRVSGILVPFNNGRLNAKEYVNKLETLVKDPELRKQFGVEGRKRALRLFTNEQIVEEHLDIIREFS